MKKVTKSDRTSKLEKTISKFASQQQKLAEKYGCKISVSFSGPLGRSEEITIADGRKDKK